MQLDDFLGSAKAGDLLLFEGNRPFSWLIKRWTSARYSHAAVYIGNGELVEAMEHAGVRIKGMRNYMHDCAIEGCPVHWYAVTDQDYNREQAVNFCLGELGLPYSSLAQFAESFGFFHRLWRRLFGGQPRDVDPNGWFCSELACAALWAGGIDPEKVKPDTHAFMQPFAVDPQTLSAFTCLQHRGEVEP